MSRNSHRKTENRANDRMDTVISWELLLPEQRHTIELPKLTGGNALVFSEGAIHGGKAAVAHLLGDIGKRGS